MLNYGVSDAVVNGVATPFTTQTAKPSLCKVDGMYGGDINGTTSTVGFEAMTALKRDGSASIPAPLVPELKGKRNPWKPYVGTCTKSSWYGTCISSSHKFGHTLNFFTLSHYSQPSCLAASTLTKRPMIATPSYTYRTTLNILPSKSYLEIALILHISSDLTVFLSLTEENVKCSLQTHYYPS